MSCWLLLPSFFHVLSSILLFFDPFSPFPHRPLTLGLRQDVIEHRPVAHPRYFRRSRSAEHRAQVHREPEVRAHRQHAPDRRHVSVPDHGQALFDGKPAVSDEQR